jgi:hypothetical protein
VTGSCDTGVQELTRTAHVEDGSSKWVSLGGRYRIFHLGSAASAGGLWLPAGNGQVELWLTPASPENELGIATARPPRERWSLLAGLTDHGRPTPTYPCPRCGLEVASRFKGFRVEGTSITWGWAPFQPGLYVNSCSHAQEIILPGWAGYVRAGAEEGEASRKRPSLLTRRSCPAEQHLGRVGFAFLDKAPSRVRSGRYMLLESSSLGMGSAL